MIYSEKETGKRRYVNSLINKVNEVVRISKLEDEVNNKTKKFINIYYCISPNDLNIKLNIVEDGKTVVENARKKAKAYYDATKIPTIAGDTALFIEKFEEQPGLYVHRVNGKELTIEETLEYYVQELKKVGGTSEAYYYTGLVIIKDDIEYNKEIKEDKFIFTSKMSDKPSKYDGLSRIQIDPRLNKYVCELTEEDIKNRNNTFDVECVNFIKSVLI